MMVLWMWLLACGGDKSYIVEGTVVQVTAADEVILDHEAIPGLMGAMTMPFHVRDPSLLVGLEPGHKVLARFEIGQQGGALTKVRVTGKGLAPKMVDQGPGPLRKGQMLPRTEVVVEDGSTVVIGEGQDRPTLVTFLYTRCPVPEFCPATVGKLQALQAAVTPAVRLMAITLDPKNDTPEVLTAFGARSSADPAIWRFGSVADLQALALSAALPVQEGKDEIVHGIRVLVLDREGRMQARHDDHDWSVDEVVTQLR